MYVGYNQFYNAGFDDNIVRKIIDQVTVLDANKIRVIFKNGYQLEQQLPE
jgi:hypothetical protein